MGSELIKQMLSKGVQKIYNLDLKLSVERDSRIDYRRCDVGNESELKQSLDNILSELKEQNRNITIPVSYTHLDVYKRQPIEGRKNKRHFYVNRTFLSLSNSFTCNYRLKWSSHGCRKRKWNIEYTLESL